MAWEENSCICLHMQLIAILSRIGVRSFIKKLEKLFGKLEKLARPERHKATRPEAQKFIAQGQRQQAARPKGAEALSPGQRPGLACSQTCRPVRAKALKLQGQFVKLLPLQGDLLIAFIPRALPWAKSFCPFRACCLVNTPTKTIVLTPLTP